MGFVQGLPRSVCSGASEGLRDESTAVRGKSESTACLSTWISKSEHLMHSCFVTIAALNKTIVSGLQLLARLTRRHSSLLPHQFCNHARSASAERCMKIELPGREHAATNGCGFVYRLFLRNQYRCALKVKHISCVPQAWQAALVALLVTFC